MHFTLTDVILYATLSVVFGILPGFLLGVICADRWWKSLLGERGLGRYVVTDQGNGSTKHQTFAVQNKTVSGGETLYGRWRDVSA